jgi:hypothetical protein
MGISFIWASYKTDKSSASAFYKTDNISILASYKTEVILHPHETTLKSKIVFLCNVIACRFIYI